MMLPSPPTRLIPRLSRNAGRASGEARVSARAFRFAPCSRDSFNVDECWRTRRERWQEHGRPPVSNPRSFTVYFYDRSARRCRSPRPVSSLQRLRVCREHFARPANEMISLLWHFPRPTGPFSSPKLVRLEVSSRRRYDPTLAIISRVHVHWFIEPMKESFKKLRV